MEVVPVWITGDMLADEHKYVVAWPVLSDKGEPVRIPERIRLHSPSLHIAERQYNKNGLDDPRVSRSITLYQGVPV